MNFRTNRRAVSPIIATLLLVAIAVAGSVITYTWAMSMTSNQSQKAQTQIALDLVMFGSDGAGTDGVYASIRNTGSVAATIDTVYLFKGDALIFQTSISNMIISVGQSSSLGITDHLSDWTSALESGGQQLPTPATEKFNVPFSVDLVQNNAYQLKILTNNGFQTMGTFYTPGSW